MFRRCPRALLVVLAAMLLLFSERAAAQIETRTFPSPMVKGLRLDWCKHFGSECGGPAAALFCKEMGYDKAARFVLDQNIGGRGIPTLVIGDGRTCKGPTCSGFRAITCEKAKAIVMRPKPLDQPAKPPQAVTSPKTGKGAEGKAPSVSKVAPSTLAALLPGGAELYRCSGGACDFRLTTDHEIDPKSASQSETYHWDVNKITAAKAVLWQVATEPFAPFTGTAPDLAPKGLAASGRGTKSAGGFVVDFKQLGRKQYLTTGRVPEQFVVRVVPLAAAGSDKIVGKPSNIIKVYYGAKAPPPPPVKFHTQPRPDYKIRVVSFTPPEFDDPNRWGCVVITGYKSHTSPLIRSMFPLGEMCPKSYRGEGQTIDSLGEFVDLLGKGWDWLGGKFDGLKDLAVDVILKYSIFGLQCQITGVLAQEAAGGGAKDTVDKACSTAAKIAVNAGLAALGVPPTLPRYNELLDRGVDYAVELAADKFEAETGVPCVGPCKDALRKGFREAANELKGKSAAQGCVGTEEANKRGREPLCVPDLVEAKPAKGAVYSPPVAVVEIVRGPDAPVLIGTAPTVCIISMSMKVENTYPGGYVSGPSPGSGTQVPLQKIAGELYVPVTVPIPKGLALGAKMEIPITFDRFSKFETPWTRDLWRTSQLEPDASARWSDFNALYSGGTAHLAANSPCSSRPGTRDVRLPRR